MLVIATHFHENGTYTYTFLTFFSISFESYTLQTMADYCCQQITIETDEKHEHLKHLAHYEVFISLVQTVVTL